MTFPGGVHPLEAKEITENCPITAGPEPKTVQILLSQHLGAPCKEEVKKRDTVTVGQVIGKSQAFVSAAVHSSVNGTVKDIALVSHPVLGRAKAVIIDAAEDSPAIELPDDKSVNWDLDEEDYDPDEIINSVNEAGVVGMGGAGFPTRVKMSRNPQMPLDTIIINGCECEPYITCDYRMMLEKTDKIIAGVKLIKKAAGCENVYIGIEDNKPKAIEFMAKRLKEMKNTQDFKLCRLKTKYPQGGEKQLIRSVLKKDVPDGGIPPMIGVLVANVATAAAVAEAVVVKRPLTHRVVTVSGGGINQPGNYYCPIGTAVADIIEFCGGINDKAVKVVMGGPMMGFAIADMTTPLTKTSGAITVLTKAEIGSAKSKGRQTPCIRCGRCLQVCPVNLNPTKIAHAVKNGKLEMAKDYHINSCMECGCCSYVCPANIELTGYIKTGKILEARAKKLMPE